jgi:riboflavin biosynthesis pyrimidine reductase
MHLLVDNGTPQAASVNDGRQRPDEPDLHAVYAADWLDHGGVRANFIASADGASSVGGLSAGLQTAGDNAVFATLRDLADVILVGASTAAAEGYCPVSLSPRRQKLRESLGLAALPATAVVSASLNLDLSAPLLARAPVQSPTVIVTSAAAPMAKLNDLIDLAAGESAVRLIEAPSDDHGVDLAGAIDGLNELGYRRILFEGGPRLMSATSRSGVLTELCLTVSPMLVGPQVARIVAGPAWPTGFTRRLRLRSLLVEDHALFARYLIAPETSAQ